MSHRESSLSTKLKLSETLKTLMVNKPLNKITVGELVSICGVNRKTFYYHFENIQDLLKWTLEREAVEVLKTYDLKNDFVNGVRFVINYVTSNAHILNCAYDSLGRDEMKRFLYADFIELIKPIIDLYEESLGVRLPDGCKLFMCNFYAEGIAGILINWFKDPKAYDEATVVRYLDIMMMSSIPAAISKAAEKR